MSGIMAKLFGRGTPGKVKVSPISTAALRKSHPETPTNDELRDRVSQYVVRTQGDQPTEVQEFVRRQMFFDLKHRCGGQGRCFKGAGRCTFPRCFTMRPSIKGGEILSEKGQIEEAIASSKDVPKEILALVQLSQRDENCSEVAKAIGEELEKCFEPYYSTIPAEPSSSSSSSASAAAAEGKTPKVETATKRILNLSNVDDREVGHFVILSVWRAVLLVNDRKDEEGIDCLLDLASKLPREHRGALFSSAAGWAALHDMEVRFYRQHLQIFPELAQELFDPKIAERQDNLVEKVIKAADGDEPIVRQIAYEVFSKEISAIIARAQNAQEHSDDVEDPMGTPVVADSIHKYHSGIGGQFWDDFMNVAMMPPMKVDPKDPALGQGLGGVDAKVLPRAVMDALGRSMLLHHCAASYGALPGSDDALEGDKVKNEDVMRQKAILNRMSELVNIVKQATNAQGVVDPNAAGAGAGGK